MDKTLDIVVVVDDDLINLAATKNKLSGHYIVVTVPSGEKLFALLGKVSPVLILLDVEMPGMNGYEVMEKLRGTESTAHIPVIFLTAKADPQSEIKGLDLGAVDYITKPFSWELLIKRIDTQITLKKQKSELIRNNLSLASEVDKKTQSVLELQSAILKAIAELVECRDITTGGHIERTQHYLRMLIEFSIEQGVYAEEMRTWDLELLVLSSQLHDVGKVSIRDKILIKQGKLTSDEFEEMKKHTLYGVDIIRRIERAATDNEFLFYAEVMAGSHHEKWDGSGYPYGLKGEDIPLQGRLMAMVDVYDALTNERPYKKAFSHEQSIGIIESEAGAHFDPRIAEVFLAYEKEFQRGLAENLVSFGDDNLHRPVLLNGTNTATAHTNTAAAHTDSARESILRNRDEQEKVAEAS